MLSKLAGCPTPNSLVKKPGARAPYALEKAALKCGGCCGSYELAGGPPPLTVGQPPPPW
jgi:hypothetical protein